MVNNPGRWFREPCLLCGQPVVLNTADTGMFFDAMEFVESVRRERVWLDSRDGDGSDQFTPHAPDCIFWAAPPEPPPRETMTVRDFVNQQPIWQEEPLKFIQIDLPSFRPREQK